MPSTANNKPQKKTSTLRSMMGFLSQKGKFSTGTTESSTQAPVVVPTVSRKPSFAPNKSAESSLKPTEPASNSQPNGSLINNQQTSKELQVTANAARGLTSLFAGLSLEPGSGKEVSSEQRQATIHHLIEAAHQLTQRICLAVMGDSKEEAPDYLRAMVLRKATGTIQKQWETHKKIDIDVLAEPVEWAVQNKIPSFTQEILDLIDIGDKFTPANTLEISQMKVTNSIYGAQLKFIEVVEQFHSNQYDKSLNAPHSPSIEPFTYGRSIAEVTTDLLRSAIRIAQDNPVSSGIRDMDTMFYQNRIDRAQTLVAAQYKKITDAMLTVAFDNEIESASAVSYASSLYEDAIAQIEKRARDNFILIEKMALDVMGVENNPFYARTEQREQEKERENKPKTPIAQAPLPPSSPPRVAIKTKTVDRPTVAATNVAPHRPAYRVSLAKAPAPASRVQVALALPNDELSEPTVATPRPAPSPRG